MANHIESHGKRVARYQRTARECRDRAARAADLAGQHRHITIADTYDLLTALEHTSVADRIAVIACRPAGNFSARATKARASRALLAEADRTLAKR